MGNLRFAIKMLYNDIKQCTFYIVSMIFSTAVIFNIFNLIYNKDFTNPDIEMSLNLYGTTVNDSYLTFSIIALIVVCVGTLLSSFANMYFVYGKTKELAIAVISGRSVFSVGGILTIQNAILGFIGIAGGLILGLIMMPIINIVTYKSIGQPVNIMAFSKMGFMITSVIIVLQFIMMVLVDVGYVYRREVVDLISDKKIMYERDKRSIKAYGWIYIFLYFLPVGVFFSSASNRDKASSYAYAMYIALIGMSGIIKYVLPQFIISIKRRKYVYSKIKLQSISNLHYSLRRANLLVIILAISASLLIQFICRGKNMPQVISVTTAAFIVVILLMAITIVYRVFIEAINRKNTFKQLMLVGYTKKEIGTIIFQESTYLYLITLIVPLFHIIIMIVSNIKAGDITEGLGVLIIGTFLGTYLLSFIISLTGYKKIIFDYLKVGV
ncbi:hypothetical protein ACQPU1_14220 [Clostridium paraputrificum]|uniref:hypothetical protein n=1 Tax=Clostridium TaxID=1485 RepID=UPI003D333264